MAELEVSEAVGESGWLDPRADKIRVATIRDGEVAIAIRQREYSDAEVRAEFERGECMRGLGAQARELGHELRPVAAPGR